MEPEVAFGIVLRELRKRQDLSQEALAHQADLERNYVSLLERGLNSATVKTIFKLAPALEVTAAEFLSMVEGRLKAELRQAKPRRR